MQFNRLTGFVATALHRPEISLPAGYCATAVVCLITRLVFTS
jgi:hypothetical protein